MEHRAGEFRMDVIVDGSVVRLAVTGEIDLTAAPLLDAGLSEMAARGQPVVLVDLHALEFLDSSGLGVLITHHKALREAGRQLVILSPSPPAERALSISGLDRVLHIRTRGGGGVEDGLVVGVAEAGVEPPVGPAQHGPTPGDRPPAAR